MERYNVAGVDALSYTLSSLIILTWRTWSWSHGRYVTVSSRDIRTVAASLDHRSQWMVPLRVVSKIEAQSELHVTSSLHLHLHTHMCKQPNNLHTWGMWDSLIPQSSPRSSASPRPLGPWIDSSHLVMEQKGSRQTQEFCIPRFKNSNYNILHTSHPSLPPSIHPSIHPTIIHTYRQTDRLTDWHTDRQTYRQTDRHTDWLTDIQTYIHTYIYIIYLNIYTYYVMILYTHIYIYLYMYVCMYTVFLYSRQSQFALEIACLPDNPRSRLGLTSTCEFSLVRCDGGIPAMLDVGFQISRQNTYPLKPEQQNWTFMWKELGWC